mmetsp:Transcript_23965/g.41413  ORF Transcript_23965/g.41413 Transcript_23965/m.41413 type:complete len:226 (+) Transcript_23965:344-1021(+)
MGSHDAAAAAGIVIHLRHRVLIDLAGCRGAGKEDIAHAVDAPAHRAEHGAEPGALAVQQAHRVTTFLCGARGPPHQPDSIALDPEEPVGDHASQTVATIADALHLGLEPGARHVGPAAPQLYDVPYLDAHQSVAIYFPPQPGPRHPLVPATVPAGVADFVAVLCGMLVHHLCDPPGQSLVDIRCLQTELAPPGYFYLITHLGVHQAAAVGRHDIGELRGDPAGVV